jgi:hypothetical protein
MSKTDSGLTTIAAVLDAYAGRQCRAPEIEAADPRPEVEGLLGCLLEYVTVLVPELRQQQAPEA